MRGFSKRLFLRIKAKVETHKFTATFSFHLKQLISLFFNDLLKGTKRPTGPAARFTAIRSCAPDFF